MIAKHSRKRFAAVLALLLILAAALGGCTPEREPAAEADMLAAADAVFECLGRQDVEGAFTAATITLQYSYGGELFQYYWDNGAQYAGEYISPMGLYSSRWDGEDSFLVEYAYDYEKIGVVARLGFNRYGDMVDFSTYTHDFRDEAVLPDGVTESTVSWTDANGVVFHGVITMPGGEGAVHGAVLVQGAGALDMDACYGRIKVMRDIAWGLAERGVASIRVNKLTYEYASVSAYTYSFVNEYVEPFSEAYRILAQQARVEDVYILGHAEGAVAAPRIDSAVDSAGLVMLAGSGRPLWQLEYEQNYYYLVQQDADQSRFTNLSDQRKVGQKLAEITAMESQMEKMFGSVAYYYWEEQDSKVDLSAYAKPAFIARALDDPLNYDEDWSTLQSALSGAKLTAMEYDGLNHLFVPAGATGTEADYFEPGRVSADVLDDMAAFIRAE